MSDKKPISEMSRREQSEWNSARLLGNGNKWLEEHGYEQLKKQGGNTTTKVEDQPDLGDVAREAAKRLAEKLHLHDDGKKDPTKPKTDKEDADKGKKQVKPAR